MTAENGRRVTRRRHPRRRFNEAAADDRGKRGGGKDAAPVKRVLQ